MPTRIATVKVSGHYQLWMPKNVREMLDIDVGDQVIYEFGPKNTIQIRKGEIIAVN